MKWFYSLLTVLPLLTGIERPYSSLYLYQERNGTYHCSKCDLPLFQTEAQFDAGNGWLCFTRAVSPNVYFEKEAISSFKRYQVLCRGCKTLVGHLFHDGPPPKHLRFTILDQEQIRFQQT